jgi:hypothetical protein
MTSDQICHAQTYFSYLLHVVFVARQSQVQFAGHVYYNFTIFFSIPIYGSAHPERIA